MSSFVVTTSIAGVSRSRVWHDSAPLTLGRPLRWVLEKTPRGVRARDLFSRSNEVRNDAIREFDNSALNSGVVLKLPLSRDEHSVCELQIRPVKKMKAAYASTSGEVLNIFSGFGASITTAQRFQQEFTGKSGADSVFSLKRSTKGFDLSVLKEGALLNGKAAQANLNLSLTPEELLKIRVSFGARTWNFGLLPEPTVATATNEAAKPKVSNAEDIWFLKALRHAAVGLTAALVITWLWPAPKPAEELVPEQFTKIVMSRPAQQQQAAPAGEVGATQKVNRVEKAAVVQAFRAKALRNSINGLLKGGMSRLLTQSDFVVGRNAGQAKTLFDSKTDALRATGAETGLMNSKDVQVASIGGSGGTGKVGYGKGGGAAVAGQGNSLVSMDLGSSSVEEGLTKDEVGEVIHRHLSEVRYCYESAMLRTPGIEGRLIVNFTIGGTGAVRSSEVKSSTLPDPRLDDCILRRLATWKFPQTKGGIDVAVSYPFIFKTLGR